jgi:tRNA G26 N,N-dimethylase Trm1
MNKFKGVKTNNAKTDAKQKLRESVFLNMKNSNVLEVYCGSGEMYNAVWYKAEKYTGIDKVKFFDKRHTICGDAEKAIRLVDINDYNIFDIDAYGSPYEILDYIVGKIDLKNKKIGFVVTDGVNMDLKLGRVCKGLRRFIGYDFHIAKRANVLHDDFIKIVIDKIASRLKGKVENLLIAQGVTGAAMRYYSFVINRDAV